jgi:hypothetical protein
MLMKLEKDRLIAKVESLEANLDQINEKEDGPEEQIGQQSFDGSPGKTQGSTQKGSPER